MTHLMVYSYVRLHIIPNLCDTICAIAQKDSVMDKILDVRDFCAITHSELSEITGIDKTTWGRIFAGSRQPRLQTIYKTAKALGWQEEDVINAIARRQELTSMNKHTFKQA